MPCRSDYMEPDAQEREMSRVFCVRDELAGKKPTRNHWEGYHPKAYGVSFERAESDKITAGVCAQLSADPVAVKRLSLEAQIWWRDHQEADRERVQTTREKKRLDALRGQAIKKLTPEERKALGL